MLRIPKKWKLAKQKSILKVPTFKKGLFEHLGGKKSISMNLKEATNRQQIYLVQLIHIATRPLGLKKNVPLQTL